MARKGLQPIHEMEGYLPDGAQLAEILRREKAFPMESRQYLAGRTREEYIVRMMYRDLLTKAFEFHYGSHQRFECTITPLFIGSDDGPSQVDRIILHTRRADCSKFWEYVVSELRFSPIQHAKREPASR